MCKNIGDILIDHVEEGRVSYNGIPSLNDLGREVIKVLAKIEIDSQLFFI